MPRHNKYECNYLLFLEANSKNFKILAMADGGTGLVNGKGEVGETKEEREGVPFHGLPLAGTHHGGQIWLEKGGRSVLVPLHGKRWSVDGMATRSSRADAAR